MRFGLLILFATSLTLVLSCVSTDTSPYKQGAFMYKEVCANCHGEEGEGLADLIPPLKNSDYFKAHYKDLTCMIKNGLKGEIIVNGKMYNQPMAALDKLNDVQITNIVNFMYHSWGNNFPDVTLDEVKANLKLCS